MSDCEVGGLVLPTPVPANQHTQLSFFLSETHASHAQLITPGASSGSLPSKVH